MDCSTPAFLSFTISWSLLKLLSIESVMPSNHLDVFPFSSCLQSFPASRSFLMSQLFTLGGQSIRASWASVLASVLPVNIQGWFPLGLTGLISLQSKDSQSLLQHCSSKTSILWRSAFFASLVAQLVKNLPAVQEAWVQSLGGKIPWRRELLLTPVFWPGEFHGLYSVWGCKELDMTEQFSLSAFFMVQCSYPYTTTGKTISLTIRTFVGKVMSLLFNMLSRLVITFPSKEQVSFNLMAVVTICSDFGAQENKVCPCFHCFANYLPWSVGAVCYDLSFLNVEF